MQFDADYQPCSGYDIFTGNCTTGSPYDTWNDTLDYFGGSGGSAAPPTFDDTEGSPDPEFAYFMNASRFWTKRVLFPLVMCVGAVGNGVTIVILTRRRMRSSTNHYLTALAFSDLFYLILSFTLNLDHYLSLYTFTYYAYWRWAIMLADACSNTSVWLTVTFTVERYIAVCHPIRGKVFCTRARAKRVIWVVVFACFLVAFPTAFEWSAMEVTDPVTNTTRVRPIESELGEDHTYRTCYYWFSSITFVFLPLTLLAIFNTFLIRSVHQSKTQRRRMTMRGHRNDHARQENRITVMLIAVVIMFLLCQLPTATTLVYTAIRPTPENTNEFAVLRGLGNLFNCMMAVNAACNFVLYCAFSDRYRRTFLRTFMPCLYRRGSPNHSQTTVAGNSTYTHIEVDSVGGSFRHRRSAASLRSTGPRRGGGNSPGAFSNNSANRKSATSLMKAVAGSAANVVANRKLSGAPTTTTAGTVTTNGGAKSNGVKCAVAPHKRYFLHVPLGGADSNGGAGVNGQCAQEDSVGSDGTQETTFYSSNNDVHACVPFAPTALPAPMTSESDSTSQNSTLTVGVDEQQEMHVISLTTPDGTDKLLQDV